MQALPTRRHTRSIAWCILRQRPTGNGEHGRRDSSAAVVEGLGRMVSGERLSGEWCWARRLASAKRKPANQPASQQQASSHSFGAEISREENGTRWKRPVAAVTPVVARSSAAPVASPRSRANPLTHAHTRAHYHSTQRSITTSFPPTSSFSQPLCTASASPFFFALSPLASRTPQERIVTLAPSEQSRLLPGIATSTSNATSTAEACVVCQRARTRHRFPRLRSACLC